MSSARAQFDFLQQRLPNAVRTIGDRPFFVAGVLDNNKGDYRRLLIFLLVRGPDDQEIDVNGPAGVDSDFLWSMSGYHVNSDGTVIDGTKVPDSAAFSVALWYPPADYRGPLTITERETGKSYTYELKSEDITRTVPAK